MTSPNPLASKECTKCRQVKPLNQFDKNKRAKLGMRYRCRECRQKPPIVSKQCDCCAQEKALDQFPQSRRGNAIGGVYHKCQECVRRAKVCTECRQEKNLDQFTKAKNTVSGKGSHCLDCAARLRKSSPSRQVEATKAYRELTAAEGKAWRDQNREYLKKYGQVYSKTPAGRFTSYKSTAKSNNRVFELTLDHFEALWQKPCHYCGGDIATIGLDRVDSSKGYTLDNVVTCCFDCNGLKSNRNTSQWLAKMRRIIEHQDRSPDPRKA